MSGKQLSASNKAPPFNLETTKGLLSLDDFQGQRFILFFYPKDSTPGCTQEAKDFQTHLEDFNKQNVGVLGVSKDTVASHEKFANKYGLTFPLGADIDQAVLKAYGVWVEKKLYGRTYMGAERTTLLIDGQGKIEKIWSRVKVKGHVEDVLGYIKEHP